MKRTRVTVEVTDDTKKALQAKARANKRSESAEAAVAIEAHIKKGGAK